MTPGPLRIGVVGPLLGHHPGWVVSQGERLAERLADDGVLVRTTSGRIQRIPRAIDTALAMRSWQGEVDVVVAMVFSGPGFAMADLTSRSARVLDLPLVLWLHGGNLPTFAHRHPRWVASVLRRAAAVVAPSPYLLRAFDPAEGRSRRAPVIIPNLLPEEAGPFMPRGPLRHRVLWMRTFHPLYRPELAVDVLEGLVRRFPDTTLTMAGQDRGDLGAIKGLAQDAGLDAHVRFVGFLDGPGKARAFSEHDLFLNTSGTDNAPVSLIEAAAHGLPIVSTAVGGIPDLFPDREAALLADDAAGLTEAVSRLFGDADLASSLAAGARDRAKACTWGQVGPQWHRLLSEVTASA